MKGDETASAYLTRAKEYADALANIGEFVKDKDLVMLVISGLREEYNGLKSTLLARQNPTSFTELYGLLSDHDYVIKKFTPVISPAQAFTAVTTNRSSTTITSSQPDTMQALQQLVSQLGFQLQPLNQPSSQAFFASRSQNSRGRGSHNRRGRGSFNNQQQYGGNRNQFSWASNQNTVYGSCNKCGIGHVPSQCPNRDPATIRPRQQQPSTNFADYRSQPSSTWLPARTVMLPKTSPSLKTMNPTTVRMHFMLVMVRVYPFFILAPLVSLLPPKPSLFLIYFMFNKSNKIYFRSKNFVKIIMFILNFTLPFML